MVCSVGVVTLSTAMVGAQIEYYESGVHLLLLGTVPEMVVYSLRVKG